MATYGMHEAKTHLSKLVEQALAGEEVVITRSGEPVVRLEPARKRKRGILALEGTWKDNYIAPDWDEWDEEHQRAFGMID